MTYTKQMANENRQMKKIALDLLPHRAEVEVVKLLEDQFPEVNSSRIERLVGQAARILDNPNRAARKLMAEDEKAVKFSITLPPAAYKVVQQTMQEQGLSRSGAIAYLIKKLTIAETIITKKISGLS
jgi:hypothetical protein